MIYNLVFPHQLFKPHPLEEQEGTFVLIEERLFFKQYKFHKQKITFHRGSLKYFQDYLENKGKNVQYIDSKNENSDLRVFLKTLNKDDSVNVIDPTDFLLNKYITEASNIYNFQLNWFDSPLFINSKEDNISFFKPTKKKFFQTAFYKQQRKNLNILLTSNGKPEGGEWSYDRENRKPYPKNKIPPAIHFPKQNKYYKEAKDYVQKNFSGNYGDNNNLYYPTTHKEAKAWFNEFLNFCFHDFGPYEDAIVKNENFLNHSILSPLINSGLLNVNDVLSEAIIFAKENDVSLNSLEGFVRQIIGWREFIRGMYEVKGVQQRNSNFWNHQKEMPEAFYNATTGIPPIDDIINKILETGYCHHIERLMLLSNFMLLCEIKPNAVYKWFMTLFIDAYDWVMVPNVYGMSLYADGGLLSTKPYISASNYALRMSDYPKGEWTDDWDALFWNFTANNATFYENNSRIRLMLTHWENKSADKKEELLVRADKFLQKLHQ